MATPLPIPDTTITTTESPNTTQPTPTDPKTTTTTSTSTSTSEQEKEITNHLKQIYHQYRHTTSPTEKGTQFFSPIVIQICAPNPAYAATDRETIVRYVSEASSTLSRRGWYTIRPLTGSEQTHFETDEIVKYAGGVTVEELRRRKEVEGWVGMRVDLWWEGESESESGKDGEDGNGDGVMVKVQYWWRKEGEEGKWMQILHDIMYMGGWDGTEGTEGDEVLE